MEKSLTIRRIKESCNNKLKEKGSLFRGFAIKSETPEAALGKLRELKSKYFDATHHCYAYKISTGEEKYSDDGEPNGTAGIRILNSINHFTLTDILVVIVRYFGGTKLGVGPLGKAYAETSLALLNSASIQELTLFQEIKISYNYNFTSQIHYLMNKFNVKMISKSFDSLPIINCFLEPFLLENFTDEITQLTNGQVQVKVINNQIYLG